MRRVLWLALAAAALAVAGIDELAILPMDDPAIQYTKGPVHDRVSALQQRLAKGEIKLAHDQEFGYLPSLLKALDVPQSSQVLVFSKTSFQAPKIAPRTPRALYHTDDVMVGYVRGGDVLELAAVDPRQGVVFYTLDQWEGTRPAIVRRGECFQCHVGAATLGVPGLVVRSVHAERTGYALLDAPAFVTDHRSPLQQRWGGWYVTGTHGNQLHMGNQTVESRDDPELDLSLGANVTDLTHYFDKYAYLQPTSDIVSLMMLEHKTRMTNLITRLGWETRLGMDEARLAATAEELVRYMLFADETPLDGAYQGLGGLCGGVHGAGPEGSQGPVVTRPGHDHADVTLPLQFPDLFGTIRWASAIREGPGLPPLVQRLERRGPECRIRAFEPGRPAGDSGNFERYEERPSAVLAGRRLTVLGITGRNRFLTVAARTRRRSDASAGRMRRRSDAAQCRMRRRSDPAQVGRGAGRMRRGSDAAQVGRGAGRMRRRADAAQVGRGAGRMRRRSDAAQVGRGAGRCGAGRTRRRSDAAQVGRGAGRTRRRSDAAQVGRGAGRMRRRSDAAQVGCGAGRTRRRSDAAQVGHGAGRTWRRSPIDQIPFPQLQEPRDAILHRLFNSLRIFAG